MNLFLLLGWAVPGQPCLVPRPLVRQAAPKPEVVRDLGLLDGEPVLDADRSARAGWTKDGGVVRVTVTQPGSELGGVRLLWPQPTGRAQGLAGRRLRLRFSAQADVASVAYVRAGLRGSTSVSEGDEGRIELTPEWRRYSVDLPIPEDAGKGFAFPMFLLSGRRGTVSFRSLSLGTVDRPMPTLRDVLSWHAALPERFRAGDLEGIVGAWSPKYIDSTRQIPGVGHDQAVRSLREQMAYKGEFSNGPQTVWVRSIARAGKYALVKGFWTGSWQTPIDPANVGILTDGNGNVLTSGGTSFSGDFRAVWKRDPEGWREISYLSASYRKVTPTEVERLRAAHEALMAQPPPEAAPPLGGLRLRGRTLPWDANAAQADAVLGRPFASGTMPTQYMPGTKIVMGQVYDYRLYRLKGLQEIRVYFHHDWKGADHSYTVGVPEPTPRRLALLEFVPLKGEDWRSALRAAGVATVGLSVGPEFKDEREILGLKGLPPATYASWSPSYYLERGDAHVVRIDHGGWSY